MDSDSKKILNKSKKEILFNILTSTTIRALLLIITALFGYAISYITNMQFNLGIKVLLISIGLIMAYYFIEHLNQVAVYKLYNKIYSKLSANAIDYTKRNSLYSFTRFSLGEYSNIMNSDIDIMASFYANLVSRLIRVLELIVIFYYFYLLDYYIFAISLIASLIMFLVMLVFGKKTEIYSSVRKKTLDLKTSKMNELFLRIRDVKGLNLFSCLGSRVNSANNSYLKDNAKYNIQLNSSRFFVLAILEVVRLILIIYGIYLISKGQMEIGVLIILANYFSKIIDNFSIVAITMVEYRNLKVSAERYNKIIEYAHEVEEETDHFDIKGKIEFKNVLYGCKEDPILKDASFVINENEITAITGRASDSKEGIFDLLLKLNKQHSGDIFVDDINIKDIHGDVYYKNISSVQKDSILFDMSIKDNFMLVNDSFKTIKEICELLNIDEYISNLPEGYDTIISDKRANIQGSIIRMILIARAIISNHKILLFDEIIEMLDKDNKKIVLKVLNELKKDHTIIIITKDKNIIKQVNNIIVVDGNKIVEMGKEDDLVNAKGLYYSLFYE